jgi:hypothetical protein
MLEKEIIEKHFPMQVIDEQASYQAFRQALIDTIEYLLQHNIERLSQAMYRIDVDEAHFRCALYQNNPTLLADLAIERVKQKILFRQQYENNGKP